MNDNYTDAIRRAKHLVCLSRIRKEHQSRESVYNLCSSIEELCYLLEQRNRKWKAFWSNAADVMTILFLIVLSPIWFPLLVILAGCAPRTKAGRQRVFDEVNSTLEEK